METTRIIKPQEGFQEQFVRSNVDFVVGGGVLNPQPWDSLVATPKGFVRISELKSGDVICNTKGGLQKVNYILHKGLLPCVEFTLSDGRSVKSALSHNWQVRDKHKRVKEITAKQIIEYYDKEIELSKGRKQKKRNLLKLTLCQPVVYSDIYSGERKVHPYVLGFILGDGCMTQKAAKPTIYTYDAEIVERFNELGYKTTSMEYHQFGEYVVLKDDIKANLQDLGVWGCTAKDKFIPKAYKYASLEDRLALLQGLFDADGCCTFAENSKSPRVNYVTVSKQMCEDVKEMIHSLGGVCGVFERDPYIRDWGDKISYCQKSYTLYPHIYNDKDLFFLPRKKERAISDEQRCHKLQLAIVDYKILPPQEMYCINVDDDAHLYLTDGYVVTCNCGKTAGAVLMCAEPSLDPNFRGVFLRNNLGDLRSGGGILDEFKNMYRGGISVVESGEPRAEFPSGARIDVTHIADQTREKVRQRFKGRQYDLIYFDEMTGFSWECFVEVCTRNRGTAKWTGKIRGTTNPDRNHWLRIFLDWYIGIDGFIREDREGVVRYFYINGETVKDVVWGDTKEEIYQKCKIQIDRQLKKVNGAKGNATYKDLIRSFTFYLGRLSENKASIGNNSGYVGAVAMAGGRNAEQLLEGNWNVSPNEDLNAPIPQEDANMVFVNDPRINGDKWITCDLADTGTDNFLALAWDGFHVIDILILGQSTPRQNAERLGIFAEKHDIPDSHIIYDAIRGTYINDYIPDAMQFVSYRAPLGKYARMALKLKDECYLRLVEMIKRGDITIDDSIAKKIYEHQKLKENITIQNEFLEECSVVRFRETPNGKKTLLSKKEMNAHLGKGRSMDLLDPCAMRMLPVLEFTYGDELTGTANEYVDEEDDDNDIDIYDETIWC